MILKNFIKPINLGDENDSNETLEIDKKDKNVKVLNIENGKRNCLVEDENMFKIFIFDDEEIVNRNILKKYLRNIIPNTNEIIKKYIKEFGKIDDKTVSGIENNLAYYDLKLDDFTFDNLKELIGLLYQHNQKLADDADEENKFMKFLKICPKLLEKNIPFINAKSLNELKQFIMENIHTIDQLEFDNQLTRLQWIFSREDHGELYFKK